MMCSRRVRFAGTVLLVALFLAGDAVAASRMDRYYAYPAQEDAHGVIAPWYAAQNGQWDFRVRIAAETLKRYPWTEPSRAVAAAPEFVFSGAWNIAPDGTISIPPIDDWATGDLGQRAAYVISGLVDYYRYSGDPAAIALFSVTIDTLLDHCLTGAEHPWPEFLISVPVKGKPYGKCDANGMIQLDIAAEVGIALVRAYQVTGNARWWETAKHWADLFAEHCAPAADHAPWLRYANPESAPWPQETQMTGGVVFVLAFLDEVIRLGYVGGGESVVAARDAGLAYLRDVLLPDWTVNDVWGRNYWDWPNPVQAENVTEFAVRYFMEHPGVFPNWRNDARNVMSLFLNHSCVSPDSNGDTFSGAWAYPEGCGCCGRSLWYGPMEFATVYAQYGALAGSAWGREMARRQQLLATYDCRETGVVEDNIDGGAIVAGAWFKIAHPMALKHVLGTMAWMPETLGAARENHIMRTSSVVRSVVYGKGEVSYETFDAPANTVDVVRLAFEPGDVTANGEALSRRAVLDANGYTSTRLPSGDAVVSIRHDGSTRIRLAGADPQEMTDDAALAYTGEWASVSDAASFQGGYRTAATAGAEAAWTFSGNQVRVMGGAGPNGGLADVYLDDVKQLAGIDCWNPAERQQQVLYYKNGLEPGEHRIGIVARGARNPVSGGSAVYIDAIQWSGAVPDAATPETVYGSGSGPAGAQRMICGYTGRAGHVDSLGQTWLPATEVVARLGNMADSVAGTWLTTPQADVIRGTPDPELYRYGIRAAEFWVNVTVGPGVYHVRLKFAQTVQENPKEQAVTVRINGLEVVSAMDVAATAGGLAKAVDLVFNDIQPQHGVIEIRFSNPFGLRAAVQAIEIGPGPGGEGAAPVSVAADAAGPAGNLLLNPGFEYGVPELRAKEGGTSKRFAWTCEGVGPSESYVYPESVYIKHPALGLPDPRSGQEALRTHSSGNGRTRVYQDVGAQPNTPYAAAVWAKTVDLAGQGFGANPGDLVRLIVAELAADGRVLAEHSSPGIAKAAPYQRLEAGFTTSADTAGLRFVLDTAIGCTFEQGHAVFDDCMLARTGGI